MTKNDTHALESFQNLVAVRFQLYNGLFLSLPYDRIEKTGILLSLFLNTCEEGFAEHKSTPQIVDEFFENHTQINSDQEKTELLINFVRYAERQVVLFDALEDAAFSSVNDMHGAGTLKHLESTVLEDKKFDQIETKLRDFFVRIVLTAHPTQFYPGSVLGIINDLTKAIAVNNISDINTYLQQLGRTRFIKKEKPTPFDEATSLIWYLENVFYFAAGNIVSEVNRFVVGEPSPIKMGFWSGGDRDGNPFVNVGTTLQVAAALHRAIVRCYLQEVRQIKRRLTFSGVESLLIELEQKLYRELHTVEEETGLEKRDVMDPLLEIREVLTERHSGLFVHLVNDLIYKVDLFGLYFATLDIRQESTIHSQIMAEIAESGDLLPADYAELSPDGKIAAILKIGGEAHADDFENELTRDTLETIAAIRKIQRHNGEAGCDRYIISQCRGAVDAMEVFGLFLLAGWRAGEVPIDIVPLFETVTDLQNAAAIMRQLYETDEYRQHLSARGNTQTIMLGFSDGTKDGGYLMANWSIYRAKDELTAISKEFGVDVIFFDGRGGPPARGGGKTHKFYASMGSNISDKAIELTVQGQTVSSNFGTIEAAQFNIEQLLNAGTYRSVAGEEERTFTPDEEQLIQRLADESYHAYQQLKDHPTFLDYLLEVSPLRFYSETNIGSRPVKRGGSARLEFSDLRAIPFVGAWSQIKQNVPGYYGVGYAFQKLDAEGRFEEVRDMYRSNAFFKALLDNCEMAMVKSHFAPTAFLADHPVFGDIWNKIHAEYELTRRYLLLISEKEELMADYPVELQSIRMRERIMIPLTTIQQYGIAKTREMAGTESDEKTAFENLIMRCSFGIINAGRNSA